MGERDSNDDRGSERGVQDGDWAHAAALFDELAPLTGEQRSDRLRRETVPAEVRRWLDELLAAHDDDRSLIIDREVDVLARSLAPEAPVLAAEDYIGQRFGPWRAEDEIGRGGMGVVLAGARDDGQFDMQVAIKLLDPQRFGSATREAIRSELRMLASLEHPGIARLIDGGVRDDDVPYLVMERIEGEPITAWAERVADLERRVRMLIQVGHALAHCHARLVVHGDIKPANVLVDDQDRARLLDFGIASRLGATATAPNGWCSPGYAAPERLRGAPPAIAEDVYAFGALAYSVLTGTGIRSAPEQTRLLTAGEGPDPGREEALEPARPDAPSTRLERLGRHREARRVRGDLDAVVLQMLAGAAADRYESVRAAIDDLEAWCARRPVRVRNGGATYRARLWTARNRGLAAAVALGTTALLGGTGVALWQADRARDSAETARIARDRAELALARADSVNRFLVDLFRARIPDLPPDQLPTTAELMERGIEKARDPSSGPPALRAELLVTLAEILAARRQLDEADALLDEAAGLVEGGGRSPGAIQDEGALRLRLAVARADSARARNRLDDADRRLDEAIALYRASRPEDPARFELERDRGRVLMRRERFDEAEQVLLALQADLERRPGTDDLALRVAGDLAAIAGSTGRHDLALERFETLLQRKRALDHPPLSLATTEINIASLAKMQFRYDEAAARFDAVIERLAPFTEVPRAVRATALKGHADIARIRGDFEAAEAWLQRAAEEWARVLDLASVDEDFFIHYYGGRLDAERGRHASAAERTAVAIERLAAGQEGPSHRIGLLHADRARYLCRAGEFDAADRALGIAQDWPGDIVRLAENEARAVCSLLREPSAADPAWIPPGHIDHALEQSGDAAEVARLELLRAELLELNGHNDEAARLRTAATRRLDDAGAASDHPLRGG